MPGLTEVASRRFVLNVASNVAYAVLNVGLMAWYIPFLVRHLGVDAYGMIPLSNTLVMYAAVVSASLDTSTNRFLAIEVNRANTAGANQVFNAALVLSLAGCGVLAIPALILALSFPALFKVPPGLGQASSLLFAAASGATLLAILSGNFAIASMITHRFDLRNAVRGATSVARFGLVAVLFALAPASLYHVAAGFVLSACIGLIGDVWIWRRLMPQLRLGWRYVEGARVRAMMSLGGWSMVNQVGFLLLMQIDLILVNRFFGAEGTGRYGSLMLFPALIFTMAEPVIAVLSPAIMARYAVGDQDGLLRLVKTSVKLLGLGLALPVGLLCGFARPILRLWLGSEFAELDGLVILLVGPLTISLAGRPIAYLLTAYNRMRLQGMVTLALGAANIGLAIALVRGAGWGMAGVAAAGAIVWLIRSFAFLSTYGAVVAGRCWWAFYRPLLAGAACTAGIGLMGKLVVLLWAPAAWVSLAAWATGFTIAYGILLYVIGLSRSDHELLEEVMPPLSGCRARGGAVP